MYQSSGDQQVLFSYGIHWSYRRHLTKIPCVRLIAHAIFLYVLTSFARQLNKVLKLSASHKFFGGKLCSQIFVRLFNHGTHVGIT